MKNYGGMIDVISNVHAGIIFKIFLAATKEQQKAWIDQYWQFQPTLLAALPWIADSIGKQPDRTPSTEPAAQESTASLKDLIRVASNTCAALAPRLSMTFFKGDEQVNSMVQETGSSDIDTISVEESGSASSPSGTNGSPPAEHVVNVQNTDSTIQINPMERPVSEDPQSEDVPSSSNAPSTMRDAPLPDMEREVKIEPTSPVPTPSRKRQLSIVAGDSRSKRQRTHQDIPADPQHQDMAPQMQPIPPQMLINPVLMPLPFFPQAPFTPTFPEPQFFGASPYTYPPYFPPYFPPQSFDQQNFANPEFMQYPYPPYTPYFM